MQIIVRRAALPLSFGFTALLLWGCSITLMSSYDEQIDRTATALQKQMDGFLTRMEASTGDDGLYTANATFYRDYAVDLRSLKLRAETHPKNRQSIAQYDLLASSLESLRQTHEQQQRVSADYARQTRNLFNIAWKSIIELEVAKKREDS
jgi:hypothetical protein